jgi:hypothetical protein
VKFVSSKFKIKLQDMNHLFVSIKIRFDDSTRHLSSGSAIIILVSSADRTGIEIEVIEWWIINLKEKKE